MKCFVICPIGGKDSPERERSDRLLRFVVRPALEVFDFEVIRADEIPGPGIISSEVVELVQTSDLCVVDLTGSNPNVFYEVGRRHETGRPWIQMIQEGERIPFDLAGIRTIQYSLDSPESIHGAITDVRSFVEVFSREGFRVSSSGESLSTIKESLERLTRTVSTLATTLPNSRLPNLEPSSKFSLKHPVDLVEEGVKNQDPTLMALGLQRAYAAAGPIPAVEVAMVILAQVGVEVGNVCIRDLLGRIRSGEVRTTFGPSVDQPRWMANPLDEDDVSVKLLAVADSLRKVGRAGEVADELAEVAGFMETHCDNPDQVSAVQNKIGMTMFSAARFEEAADWHRRALATKREAAYQYNLAFSLERAGDDEGAETEAAELFKNFEIAAGGDHHQLLYRVLGKSTAYKDEYSALLEKLGEFEDGSLATATKLARAAGVDEEDLADLLEQFKAAQDGL